jgi:tetratricopeptide (TPR) repeat protein
MPYGQARRFVVGEVPPLADEFTERPDTAAGIIETLTPGSAVALVPSPALSERAPDGPGVCGKTQIAVMAAESLWRSGAIDALIWISATNRASVLSGFVRASVAVSGIEPAGTADSVAARFVAWLGETSRAWLVVLDDLPEPAILDRLWPQGPTGRLLITSTQSAVAAVVGRRGAQVIPVGFFSVREALNCLAGRLSMHPVQRQGAMELVADLSCEPLALAQASAVIANSTLACRDYRDYFLRRREQIGAAEEVPAVTVTWTLSLGQAEALLPGPSVRLMLVLVVLLDGHGIPGAVFGAPSVAAYLGGSAAPFSPAADPGPAWDALLTLERVGLISINHAITPPVVLMNTALQAAIRLSAPSRVQEPAARAAAAALLESWPAEEPEPWTADSLRANAASLHSAATDTLWSDGCHPLLLRVGRSLDGARLVGPAAEYWRDLAARCDAKLAPGHPDALLVADHLAAANLAAGSAAEAVTWYQRVLAERGRELASGHPTVVAARVSLARALIMAREPADAVAVLQRAVRDCEQSRGPDHTETLGVTEELAAAYQAAGETTAAVQLLTRTLAGRERLRGARDAQTLAARDRLAAACLADGKVKDAISHYKRVLADRERVLGRGDPDTIATCAKLAAAYHAAGRMPSAMQLSERCCADSEQVLGPDHADTLARRANLALLYYAVGRVGDAVDLLHDTAIRCQRVLPPGDPLTRAVQQSLANIGEG